MFAISSNNANGIKIAVPKEIYNNINNRDYRIYIGKKQFAADLLVDETIPSDLAVFLSSIFKNSKPLASRQHHEKLQLNSRLLPGPILKFGPVVGVLVARKTESEYPLPSGKEAKIYAEMSEAAAKRNMLMYFFYADGVDWKRQIVSGHRYARYSKGKSGWSRAIFPLPDIIYNRIAYRSRERQNHVQVFLEKAADESIYVFNSRFLNKWEVHKGLYTNPITRTMLPETYRFSKERLVYCLAKFSEFFVKPTGSSVGKGIIKVKVDSPQSFTCYKVGSKTGWQKSHTSMQLFKQLKILEGEKYILQQGINLASIAGNVFDVRAQVQKNGQDEWQITGAAVRVAAPGQFVTHVPNGGTKANYESTIKELYGDDNEIIIKLNQQLATIAQLVPRVLEQNLGLNLAILSLDIGIDKEGKMWIIEANSKPASFDEDDIRRRHLNLLNDYLLYKTDFSV